MLTVAAAAAAAAAAANAAAAAVAATARRHLYQHAHQRAKRPQAVRWNAIEQQPEHVEPAAVSLYLYRCH